MKTLSMGTAERRRILAVDDDPCVRALLTNLLSPDYELVVLPSGENLELILDDFNPDLIMLDVRMPGMDGLEVCRTLRRNPAHDDVSVLFLSAAYEGPDLVNGIDSGADYYMAKPFRSNELRRVVAACIERKMSTSSKKDKNS